MRYDLSWPVARPAAGAAASQERDSPVEPEARGLPVAGGLPISDRALARGSQ